MSRARALATLLALTLGCASEKSNTDTAAPRDTGEAPPVGGEGEGEREAPIRDPGLRDWFPDADADGYGSASAAPIRAPWAPPGFVASSDDCDDADAQVHPGADEHCDDRDEDCDGSVDENATDAPLWHPDADADGYGADDAHTASCAVPDNHLEDASDCDDTDAEIHPGVEEYCGDDVDNDCDGEVDEVPPDYDNWRHPDLDEDHYGDESAALPACTAPETYIETGGDCDDTTMTVHPGAYETCETGDNDCDGLTGSDDDDVYSVWYMDGDGDGYGVDRVRVPGCEAPDGAVAERDDCDDTRDDISPAADEVCGDVVDEDCDGIASDCGFWGDHDIAEVAVAIVSSEFGKLGFPVATAGDLDDDGHDDMWIGATSALADGDDCGAVHLVPGGLGEGDIADLASATILGDTDGAKTGWRIEPAGDVDGDGYPDLWTGSPWDLDDDSVTVGSASLFLGPHTGTRTLGDADLEWMGIDYYDQAGYSVAAGADLDNDGALDVAVASIRRECCDDQRGEVYVLYQDGRWGARSLGSADYRLDGDESPLGIECRAARSGSPWLAPESLAA